MKRNINITLTELAVKQNLLLWNLSSSLLEIQSLLDKVEKEMDKTKD